MHAKTRIGNYHGGDQPANLQSLISAVVVRNLDNITFQVYAACHCFAAEYLYSRFSRGVVQ